MHRRAFLKLCACAPAVWVQLQLSRPSQPAPDARRRGLRVPLRVGPDKRTWLPMVFK